CGWPSGKWPTRRCWRVSVLCLRSCAELDLSLRIRRWIRRWLLRLGDGFPEKRFNEKQPQVLRLWSFAAATTSLRMTAVGEGSCFPRSQKRDLGHPASMFARYLKRLISGGLESREGWRRYFFWEGCGARR